MLGRQMRPSMRLQPTSPSSAVSTSCALRGMQPAALLASAGHYRSVEKAYKSAEAFEYLKRRVRVAPAQAAEPRFNATSLPSPRPRGLCPDISDA